jgi:plastocyanin domain-containing protein
VELLDSIRRGLHANGHDASARREVSIRVRGGYAPDTIHAEAGVPLRLVVRREETSSCSEQVIFPAFGRSAMLPTGEPIAVDLLPDTPGEYEFTCAMGMLHGRLIVERTP